jgi:hypothetical protein
MAVSPDSPGPVAGASSPERPRRLDLGRAGHAMGDSELQVGRAGPSDTQVDTLACGHHRSLVRPPVSTAYALPTVRNQQVVSLSQAGCRRGSIILRPDLYAASWTVPLKAITAPPRVLRKVSNPRTGTKNSISRAPAQNFPCAGNQTSSIPQPVMTESRFVEDPTNRMLHSGFRPEDSACQNSPLRPRRRRHVWPRWPRGSSSRVSSTPPPASASLTI